MKRMLVLAGAIAMSAAVWAAEIEMVKPERVGLSSQRLERITDEMRANVHTGRTPGALGLIARDGKIAYFETVGMADREAGAPMDEDTIFRIYSMSKPITSVALMILYEEGAFMLNEPVSKYIPKLGNLMVAVEESEIGEDSRVFNLPDDPDSSPSAQRKREWNVKAVPAHRDMTIRDLMRHTSGLTYGFFGSSAVDQMYMDAGILVTDEDLDEMVNKLSEFPLKHQPGTTWEYSVSVDVQGRLVEVLSGQPFDEFLEEHIFEPLDMRDTAFYVPQDELPRFAQMYRPKEDGTIEPAPAHQSRGYVNEPTLFSGGGGLVSTARDYLRFCQMMLNGGELDGVRILSRKTVELMTKDHLGEISMGMPGYTFGLGFAIAEDLGEAGAIGSEGEYNWGGAAGTRFWIDPEENFIGIYMVQILPHTGLNYGTMFKQLAYQAIVD